VLAALPPCLYIRGDPFGGSRRRRKAVPARRTVPTPGTALARVGTVAMQSILAETQDVELLLATALTAAGYVIGAAAFLSAFL
jgi:hypothetical protein